MLVYDNLTLKNSTNDNFVALGSFDGLHLGHLSLINKVKDIDNLIIYNSSETGIFSFNIDGVFAQDSSIYLNQYNIYVRAGNHCAKLLKDEINIKNTIRASMYFYNTFQVECCISLPPGQ